MSAKTVVMFGDSEKAIPIRILSYFSDDLKTLINQRNRWVNLYELSKRGIVSRDGEMIGGGWFKYPWNGFNNWKNPGQRDRIANTIIDMLTVRINAMTRGGTAKREYWRVRGKMDTRKIVFAARDAKGKLITWEVLYKETQPEII